MPFRWDIAKREQLGGLIDGPLGKLEPRFLSVLRSCCSRVVAFAGDRDLVFVGRSPENLFDFLSGLFSGLPQSGRLTLLQLSLHLQNPRDLAGTRLCDLAALYDHLADLGLDPESLIHRERPVAFVDFVSEGSTFDALTGLLRLWSQERTLDWGAVQRKVGFVGITGRRKTSPNTWRWQQHQEWLALAPEITIKNVSVPMWFWAHLANTQEKVTPSHRPDRWREPTMPSPPRDPENLEALRLAVVLFDAGRSRDERELFAKNLTRQLEMREAWFRRIVSDLRRRRATE